MWPIIQLHRHIITLLFPPPPLDSRSGMAIGCEGVGDRDHAAERGCRNFCCVALDHGRLADHLPNEKAAPKLPVLLGRLDVIEWH